MAKKKLNEYFIYGIICLSDKKLLFVDLSEENVNFEFDLQDYSEDEYAIVEFIVVVP